MITLLIIGVALILSGVTGLVLTTRWDISASNQMDGIGIALFGLGSLCVTVLGIAWCVAVGICALILGAVS